VLVFEILPGIVIGVALSLILFIHRLDHPHIARLGRRSRTGEFGDVDAHPGYTPVDGVLVLRFDAPVIFANADAFTDSIEDALDAARAADGRYPRAVVIDLEACYEIDVTGTDALLRVARMLEQRGVEFDLARAKAPVRKVLTNLGALEVIGESHLHPTIESAVARAAPEAEPPTPEDHEEGIEP
jgi:MFS superfamily sulfate permease-like transporter